jgi:hypothetical protein
MRLMLLAVLLGGAVVTTACSAVLPPAAAEPCAQEQARFSGAKAAKSLADSEALEASLKVMDAQGDALQASLAVGQATNELTGAKLAGGPDAATSARINQEIADAHAKAAAADAAIKAAQQDEARTKALADMDAKGLAAAQDRLDTCRNQSPTG